MVDIKVTVGTPPEARENANDQVAFALTFECWVGDLRTNRGAKWSKANPILGYVWHSSDKFRCLLLLTFLNIDFGACNCPCCFRLTGRVVLILFFDGRKIIAVTVINTT